MAVTSAIAIGAGISSLVVGNQLKQQQKGAQGAIQRQLEQTIAATPPPPNTAKLNDDAARQAAAASAAQRKVAAAGGSLSTILTSGQGAPAVATTKKTLLGQ
jgi:hypothetical protein